MTHNKFLRTCEKQVERLEISKDIEVQEAAKKAWKEGFIYMQEMLMGIYEDESYEYFMDSIKRLIFTDFTENNRDPEEQ